MKWNTAIKKMEKALAEDQHVEIRFHRKHMMNDVHWDVVENISAYKWDGQTCKAVNTYRNQLNEDSHIIDEIIIED